MMEYIDDPILFKAVNFASKMIKDGVSKGLAIYKSAAYYNVSKSEVASKLGRRGSVSSNMNKKDRKYRETIAH